MMKHLPNSRRLARLHLEGLERRDTPAQFGVPWTDATHLTLSFAPDGTAAGGGLTSNLNAALDAQMPRAVWREAIIRAARTWAEVANLNIGIVADGGQAFGAPGRKQGDERFGDLRVGAVVMAGDALGQALPPDPLLVGTYAGDVFFNTNMTYTATSLYSVALHEIGHALGVAPSTNPASVMFNTYGSRTALTLGDIANVRALYGTKAPDPNESLSNNNTLGRATQIPIPSSYDGATPLVAFGELGGPLDVDWFRFTNPSNQTGPITVRVQSAGISTMIPRLSIYDKRFKRLAMLDATNIEGDTLTYTLTSPVAGDRYYLRVEDVPGMVVGNLGRYGVAVTFDNLVQPTDWGVDRVLRGPYEALDATDIAELFVNPDEALFEDDDDTGDEEANGDHVQDATDLKPSQWALNKARYTVVGSLESNLDEDAFRIRAPKTIGKVPVVLTIYASAFGSNGTTPVINLYDEDKLPVATEVLVNGNGTLTLQVIGLEANRRFYFEAVNANTVGNYEIEAVFSTTPAAIQTFSAGSLDATNHMGGAFYVARTQLFAFSLAASGALGTSVTMTIMKGTETVFTLTANAGQTLSAVTQFLPPGEYQVLITSTGTVDYRLRGAVASDPLGPRPADSTLAPIYVNPSDPKTYLYPNGQIRLDPYLLLLALI